MFDRRHSHHQDTTVAEEVYMTIGDDGAILAEPVFLGSFAPNKYGDAIALAQANRYKRGRWAVTSSAYSCGCKWIDAGRNEPDYGMAWWKAVAR